MHDLWRGPGQEGNPLDPTVFSYMWVKVLLVASECSHKLGSGAFGGWVNALGSSVCYLKACSEAVHAV